MSGRDGTSSFLGGHANLVAQAQEAYARMSFIGYWQHFLAIVPLIKIVLWVVTAVFAAGIVWLFILIERAKVAEKQALGIIAEPATPAAPSPKTLGQADAAWQQVLGHMNSTSDSDWRRAILEADIMLDMMLKERGYEGETLSDRLKSVSQERFMTLDQAWDAHRVRNQIAHEGNRFQIAQPEAKRVINMYEAVFREFRYI